MEGNKNSPLRICDDKLALLVVVQIYVTCVAKKSSKRSLNLEWFSVHSISGEMAESNISLYLEEAAASETLCREFLHFQVSK